MTDSEQHPYVEWIAREARRPVVTDPAARDRIMAAVRAEPAPQRSFPFWQRAWSQPRSFTLSPAAERAARGWPRRHRCLCRRGS